MKSLIYSVIAISIAVVLSGCGGAEGKAENHAEEICDCLKDAGLDKSWNLSKIQNRRFQRKMGNKMEEQVPACFLKVLKEMEKDIENLSKKEKKEYTKAFMHASIETECSDIGLGLIPYDMLGIGIREMERQLDRSRDYRNDYDEYDDYYEEEYEEFDDEF